MSSQAPSDDGQVVRQAVTLGSGLIVVSGLLTISVLAFVNAWLGIAVGVMQLVIAWHVKPPMDARPLRWLTGIFGAIVLSYSVAWLLAT